MPYRPVAPQQPQRKHPPQLKIGQSVLVPMLMSICTHRHTQTCTVMHIHVKHAHTCTVMHIHAQTCTDMHRHAQSCTYIDSSSSFSIGIILIVYGLGTIDLFFIGGVFFVCLLGCDRPVGHTPLKIDFDTQFDVILMCKS